MFVVGITNIDKAAAILSKNKNSVIILWDIYTPFCALILKKINKNVLIKGIVRMVILSIVCFFL